MLHVDPTDILTDIFLVQVSLSINQYGAIKYSMHEHIGTLYIFTFIVNCMKGLK